MLRAMHSVHLCADLHPPLLRHQFRASEPAERLIRAGEVRTVVCTGPAPSRRLTCALVLATHNDRRARRVLQTDRLLWRRDAMEGGTEPLSVRGIIGVLVGRGRRGAPRSGAAGGGRQQGALGLDRQHRRHVRFGALVGASAVMSCGDGSSRAGLLCDRTNTMATPFSLGESVKRIPSPEQTVGHGVLSRR